MAFVVVLSSGGRVREGSRHAAFKVAVAQDFTFILAIAPEGKQIPRLVDQHLCVDG